MEHKYFYEWFRFADNDLDTAELLIQFRPQHFEIICFHCQQSAEKYLKGYLFYYGIEVPKIHLLDRLCEMCSEHDVSFDEITQQCAALTAYGVQPRYPDEIYVDEGLMRQAVSYAMTIICPKTLVLQGFLAHIRQIFRGGFAKNPFISGNGNNT